MRKLKVYETAHAPNQFTSVARLPPVPLILISNIYKRMLVIISTLDGL